MSPSRYRTKTSAALGFTLIELLAVVVIAGSVSVAAITAYADLRFETHKQANLAVAGAFAEGLKLAKAAWYVRTDGSSAVVDMPNYLDGTVDFAGHGYPQGRNVPAPGPTGLNPGACTELFALLLPGVRVANAYLSNGQGVNYLALGPTQGGNRCDYWARRPSGAPALTPSGCLVQFSYTEGAYTPGGAPGRIDTINDDCMAFRTLHVLP
jgi:prepilin-type N-terminal cleavage/methylation domain-containing protein